MPPWLSSIFGAVKQENPNPESEAEHPDTPADGHFSSLCRKFEIPESDQSSAEEAAMVTGDSTNPWRPLRSRSFLGDTQIAVLASQYKRNPFPSKYEMSALAEQIHVNKRVVQVGKFILDFLFHEFSLFLRIQWQIVLFSSSMILSQILQNSRSGSRTRGPRSDGATVWRLSPTV
jgi:hypothetical protein